MVSVLAFWIFIVSFNTIGYTSINQLSGLGKDNPFLVFCLSLIIFSIAGIPPLAGFFAKFYILYYALKSSLYMLAIASIICSMIGAFYYIRFVKIF
jgi:NADH-quinone oxidoreductase subunit N